MDGTGRSLALVRRSTRLCTSGVWRLSSASRSLHPPTLGSQSLQAPQAPQMNEKNQNSRPRVRESFRKGKVGIEKQEEASHVQGVEWVTSPPLYFKYRRKYLPPGSRLSLVLMDFTDKHATETFLAFVCMYLEQV